MDSTENELNVKEARPAYKKHYTFEDWLALGEDAWAELYDGVLLYLFTPTIQHQEIVGNLYLQIGNFLKGKRCRAFLPPFGVKLFNDEDTVLLPDILIICDKSKLEGRVVHGAPDFVVEILSPSTSKRDKLIKYNLYQKAGVREYWIIDPDEKFVQAGVLSNGSYVTTMYGSEDKASVHIIEGLEINLTDVYDYWLDGDDVKHEK